MSEYDTPFGPMEIGHPEKVEIDFGLDRLSPATLAEFNRASPEAKDAMRAQLARAGYSKEALEVLGPRSPAQPPAITAIDAPAAPEGYAPFKYSAEVLRGLRPEQLGKLDSTIREAFHGAGVPSALAQGLVSALQETASRYGNLTKEATVAAREAEWATLTKVYGEQRASQLRDDARAVAAKFNQKLDTLFPNGALSAASIVALANVGALLKHKG